MTGRSIDAMLEQFETDTEFSNHLKDDYNPTEDSLGVVYVEFNQPVNSKSEQNRAILAPFAEEHNPFISRTFLKQGLAILAYCTMDRTPMARNRLNDVAMDIRTQYEKLGVPFFSTASFIATSGELESVKAKAEEYSKLSVEKGTHWNEY